MIVCTITTDAGAVYQIHRHPSHPARYIAHVAAPVECSPLHRDPLTFSEAFAIVGLCVGNSFMAVEAVKSALGMTGLPHAPH